MYAIGYSTSSFSLRVAIIEEAGSNQKAVDAWVAAREERGINLTATILWVAGDTWTGLGSGGIASAVEKAPPPLPPPPPTGWRVAGGYYKP